MDDVAAFAVRQTWGAFAWSASLLLVCAEIGFRLGWRLHERGDEARRETIPGIQGAVLGLLGLLLGFTFAMAVSRYDARRELVVEEANAIGTAFLRASLLPEAHVGAVENLLRRYLDLRFEFTPLTEDTERFAIGLRRSAEVQRRLWEHAVRAGREAPTPIVALFVAALNEMIDVEAQRVAAMRARIPITIWLLLLIVAALGCLMSSYVAGAVGGRSTFSSIVLPLLIAIVIVLIFDLMHPRQGLIDVSQQPLIDLRRSIAPPD